MTEYFRDEVWGRRFPGSRDAQASQKRAKGRPGEDNNSQNISRDGAAQERVKRKHDGGGQETRIGVTTLLGTRRNRACIRGRQGGGGGVRNGGGRT